MQALQKVCSETADLNNPIRYSNLQKHVKEFIPADLPGTSKLLNELLEQSLAEAKISDKLHNEFSYTRAKNMTIGMVMNKKIPFAESGLGVLISSFNSGLWRRIYEVLCAADKEGKTNCGMTSADNMAVKIDLMCTQLDAADKNDMGDGITTVAVLLYSRARGEKGII